jgi:hypothetical protein
MPFPVPSVIALLWTYLQHPHPEHLVELNDKPVFLNLCLTTGKLAFAHFTAGMKCCIREHTKLVTPLLEQPV